MRRLSLRKNAGCTESDKPFAVVGILPVFRMGTAVVGVDIVLVRVGEVVLHAFGGLGGDVHLSAEGAGEEEEEEKTRLAGEKAKLEEKKRELETLRRRRIEVQQTKVTVGKDCEVEEQKRHTRVMLLIDAISKFKESMDVGWTGARRTVERRDAAAYGGGEDAKCKFLPCLF